MFRLLVTLSLLALPHAGSAGPWGQVAATAQPNARVLRVGTSGDYPPFSQLRGDTLTGSGVALARRYARARGLRLVWVRFRWPELLQDLEAGRFDLAVGGVTVRPERSLRGTFSVPVASSGAVVILPAEAAETMDSLHRPGVRIGVNAGGHLERVARVQFPKAQIEAITPNEAVRTALLEGRVDVVVSDTEEARIWLAGTQQMRVLPPFTRDRKAWLAARDSAALDRLRDVDAWLLERRESGGPLFALVASLDERLDLMPSVAEAKRHSGLSIRAPEREAAVLASALDATREAAARLGRRPPDDAPVTALFEAQFAAARQVQEATLLGPATGVAPPDLAGELRPALLRIGARIAWLVVRLEAEPRAESRVTATRVENLVTQLLDTPGLQDSSRKALAKALLGLR